MMLMDEGIGATSAMSLLACSGVSVIPLIIIHSKVTVRVLADASLVNCLTESMTVISGNNLDAAGMRDDRNSSVAA